jgi:3-oxoacyl-[acyl-carrier protein] reductase
MADRYQQFADSPPGRFMVRRLGLPQPTELRRGPELFDGPVLAGGADSVRDVITRIGLSLRQSDQYSGLIFDATRITATHDLRDVYDFFQPAVRDLAPCGRAIVVGSGEGVAQRALEGFVRSLAKELRHGATAQLVYATPGADLESTLRFLLSGRSAYVSGQVIRVGDAVKNAPPDWAHRWPGRPRR